MHKLTAHTINMVCNMVYMIYSLKFCLTAKISFKSPAKQIADNERERERAEKYIYICIADIKCVPLQCLTVDYIIYISCVF